MKDTEFMNLVRGRYDHGQEMSYEEEGTFLSLLNGPYAYQNEDEMKKYAEDHPEITMDELLAYWESITPDGLPPGMEPEELLQDDDEEEDL